jgi:hypothetical protein
MRIAQWTGLWALLCFASIVAPGVADADWKIDRAQAVAAKAWNDPCPGRVQTLYAPPPEPSWLASAIKGYCRITLSDRESWPWSQLCPVLVHEYGHLAGYRDPENPSDPFHSHDPDDIMFAFIHDDWRCKEYGTPCLGYAPPADFQPDPALGISTGIIRKKKAPTRRGASAGNGRGPAARSRAKGRGDRRSPAWSDRRRSARR